MDAKLLVVTAIAAVTTCGGRPVSPPIPPQFTGDVIAYSQVSAGATDRYEVYTMTAGGANNALLIHSTTNLNEVAYSPDARSMAASGFLGADYSNISIYRFDFSAGSLRPLTTTPNVWDNHPAYSPSGSLIAFSRRYVPRQGEDRSGS